MVDYRKFRLSKLNDPEFSHLKLLLFWPLFGLVFLLEERVLRLDYFPMHCALDDMIPFCEYFLIPYLFWFVFLVGMGLYSLLFDIPAFRRFMNFIIITYTAAAICYILFPTMQNLRPVTFARDNVFTRFMTEFYQFDTNTNVCPSIHVLGSLAVLYASWNSRAFGTPLLRAVFTVITVAICLSTVFLKQHSLLDIPPALALGIIACLISRRRESVGLLARDAPGKTF